MLRQLWAFGGIERSSKKCFIVPLVDKDRSAGTLIPIIKQYVRSGSVIYSDSWRAYHKLCDEGYTHYMINHKEQFVDPNNPNIHTQNIERLWLDLKQWSKRPGLRIEYFKQYFARYMFLHTLKEEQVIHRFFIEAGRLYRPQSNRQRPSGLPVIPQLQEESDSDSDNDAAAAAAAAAVPPPQPSTSCP